MNFFILKEFIWRNLTLTWKIAQFNEDISQNDQIRDVEAALEVWGRYVHLEFVRVEQNESSSLNFFFASRDHGDCCPFDGKGGVLAHAFYPRTFSQGDVHYDNDEFWTVRNPSELQNRDVF